MNIDIRRAVASDAPFLAWVQQEAARSHVPKGFWDLAFPGPEADRLRVLGRMLTAESRSLCHWSGFLVACVDGRPAAALSGYTQASVAGGSAFVDAFTAALDAEGWDSAAREALAERIAPFSTCMPETDDDVWIIEWVATRPEFRGRGLVRSLLPQILERGRELGISRFQICVLIGNTPAQHAYEAAGFRPCDEKRHPDFEAAMGCPGILRLTQ